MFGRDKDKKSFAARMADAAGLGTIGEIAGALTGSARPLRLADHPGMLPAKATIVLDEGYAMVENSATLALQHQKYIVDVHPENGTDPAIRAEVQCWVSWPGFPKVGDVVSAGYKPGTKEVALLLGDDERFDWVLRAASKRAGDSAARDALLNAPPD